jgi:hypothetical protein
MSELMFTDTFQFYTNYKIPRVKTYDQFMQYIEQLPLVDSPEAFGLHSNADITYVTLCLYITLLAGLYWNLYMIDNFLLENYWRICWAILFTLLSATLVKVCMRPDITSYKVL